MKDVDWDKILANKRLLVFGLDDVMYPRKDYLLQVYYLFANFVEFTLTNPPADRLLDFMKEIYETDGEEAVFGKLEEKFNGISKFRDNFDRLNHKAQLPLKLELNRDFSDLLNKIKEREKIIVIMTAGDPMMQLNKIRQTDWEGLENVLKVYFEDELNFRKIDPLDYLLQEFEVKPEEVLYIGHSDSILQAADQKGIEFLAYRL